MTSNLSERRAPPSIETDRLRLRAHTVGDLEACFGLWSDANVTRFIGGRPFTREEVWSRLLRYAGMWTLLGHGFWAIEEKDSRLFVGEVGIMDAKRDMDPPFGNEPEIGWAMSPALHGRGYAGEAVAAAIAWADENLPGRPLVCIISPDNAPSIRLANKFGFKERLRTTYHHEPTIQFERRP